jgi:transposase InsO family protein
MLRDLLNFEVYPYLLRGLLIDRPNQVWATDIIYIPMARGFVYLFAVMDSGGAISVAPATAQTGNM